VEPSIALAMATIGFGSVVALLCVPLLRGWVPMNPVYGIRFPRAMTSSERWYAVNRYGAKRLLAWSVGLIVLGLVLLLAPVSPGSPLVRIAPGAPLLLLIPVWQTFRYARSGTPLGDG